MPLQVEVRDHLGRPCLFVDGRHLPLLAYSPVRGERRELFLRQVERFARHRMALYLLTPPRALVADDWAANPFWVGDEIHPAPALPCAHQLDDDVAAILERDPEALILLRFGPQEPASWRALHPDELSRSASGASIAAPSLASERHHAAVERFSRAAVAWFEQRPWAERIVGYWNGDRQEGSHQLAMEGWLVDHSPVMRDRWRDFLRQRYAGDVTALRRAHRQRDIDFACAPLPPEPAARPDPRDWLVDPVLADYLLLLADCYAAYLRRLVAGTRAGCGDRQRLILVDSLKQAMQGWTNHGFFQPRGAWPQRFPDILAASGQIGVSPLLDSAGFDGLITPHDYQARGIGGVFEPEGIADSCVLRGRIFCCEMDTRSWHGSDPHAPARDQREFEAVTWRNLATAWTRGFHAYWMDVHQDWFADEAIHDTIARQAAVARELLELPHATVPGIAVIIDDRSQLDSDGSGDFLDEAVMWELRANLARCGVPYRVYLLDDLALERFPEQRVFYFPNCLRSDPERRELIARRCLRDGRVVVWGPASGISDGEGCSAASAEALTGFACELLDLSHPRRVLVSDYAHPVTAGLNGGTVYGGARAYGPLLLPTSGRRLGEAWTRQGRSACGLALREGGRGAGPGRGPDDYGCLFTTATGLPPALWRGIARWAGAHVYSETDDVVLASTRVLALHALGPGPRRLRLPGPAHVHDLRRDRALGLRESIDFELDGVGTEVFRLDPIAAG